MRQTQSQGTTDQVIGTSPCGQEIATTSAMADPDGAFLQKFGNRLRDKVGVLLTPPVGDVSHELRQVQSYVDGLVRDMGPRSIKGSDPSMRLVVNLYSSDTANAFVTRLDEQNGWPVPDQAEIRQHFDPENGRRPIYEIGVTLGLLCSVSSEEELRHVLAHELAHFTENHIERNSSLGSQTHEAVADAIAFQTVESCGKNPVGGLHFLQRTFAQLGPEQHKSALERSLSAGQDSHHHEGLRIAFAQAKIRQIELENPALLSLELTPVPDFVRLTVNPRQTNPEARARGLETGRKFAEECIQAAISGAPADLWIGQIRPSDIPDVLVQGLERIKNGEGATSTQKLDAIVGFIELLAESQGDASLVLSLDARSQLTRTIAGLLRDGGTFEQVIDRVKEPIAQQSADRWESLLEPALLKSLGPLVNRHPEVISLYRNLPKTVTQIRGQADRDLRETMALIVKVSTLNQGFEQQIVERLQDGALESLEGCLAAKEDLPHEGMRCLYLLERLNDQSPFEQAVREVIIDSAARSREKLLTMLEGALADSGDFDRDWKINQGLSSLGTLLRYQPLTESDKVRLGTALLDFFSQDSGQGNSGTIEVELGENPELLRFLTSLANSPLADGGQMEAIRECIFSNLPATNLPRRGTAGDLVDELTSIVNSTLDGEGIRHIAGQVRSPQISKEHHFHRLATPLALLARSSEGSQRTAQEFNFNQTSYLIEELSIRILPIRAGIHGKTNRRGVSSGVSLPLKLSGEAPRFLLDCVVASQAHAPHLEMWHKTITTLLELSPHCLNGRPEHRNALERHLIGHLKELEAKQLEEWLRKPHVTDILSSKELAHQFVRLALSADAGGARSDGSYHPWGLRNRIDRIVSSFQLEEKHPVALMRFREQLAEAIRVQPDEVNIILPEESRGSLSQQASGSLLEMRGLSALVAATRDQTPSDQIQMIEYLMGRSELPPSFIAELDADLQGQSGHVLNLLLSDLLEDARHRLVDAEPSLRTVVASSFLAGPSSILANQAGRDALLDSILRGVSEERTGFARHLAAVLLDAQSPCEALAVGFLQARSDTDGKPLSEGATLAQLFLAHGVPGIKFMQYLAFTGEFKEFVKDFEEYQDRADPPTYLEAVRLVRGHFGEDGWPSGWRVQRLKGSGSVNIAVEFLDSYANETRIVSVPRAAIDQRAKVDFRYINRFLERLTAEPGDREKFGYLLGLSRVIEKSVRLEFDRQASAEMQQAVQPLYDRTVNGWNVRTVKPMELRRGAIVMEMASGQSAVELANEDPENYRSAMKALARVELNVLLGMDQRNMPWPVPLPANPDFHNGQVFIDRENQSITLLDFGQAVMISNEERAIGIGLIDFLRRDSDSDPVAAANSLKAAVGVSVAPSDVAAILSRSEAMDRFVRTLDLVAQSGGEVPLPVVHWMVAIHRQRVLGEKIGQPIDPTLTRVLIVRALGGNLALHNAGRLVRTTVEGLFGPN